MTFLLTHHGTLLCRGAHGLVHRPADGRAGVTALRLDVAWERLRGDFDRIVRPHRAELRVPLAEGDLAGHVLHVEPDRRSVLLSRDGRFVSAQPDGSVTADRGQAQGWERFVPLPLADLDRLLALRQRDWILSGGEVVPAAAVRLGEGHALWLGRHRFDLRHQLPLDLDDGRTDRLTLLAEGWRIVQARAFRPLLCFVVVRDPLVMQQLWLCLRSLLRWGRYAGHVHVVTDQPAAAVLHAVPELPPERLTVRRLPDTDRVGIIAARYSLVDWPGLEAFAPLLLMDSDVLFDADVAPLLAHVALADRIVAPPEAFSPRRTAPSAGAELLAADGVDPGEAPGFNAGTLGVPSLRDHGATLRLVRRLLGNRSDLLGRGHFTWVDQPVANYAAQRLGGFDTAGMERFVRWGYPGLRPDDRRGVVHFWPPRGAQARLDAMRAYLAALEAAG